MAIFDSRRQEQRDVKNNNFLTFTWSLLFLGILIRVYLNDSAHSTLLQVSYKYIKYQ